MKLVDTTTIEGRIRFFAKRHFGSVKNLAEAAGIDSNGLGKYREGRLPTGEVLYRLIGVGMNAHWLLTGTGIMDVEIAPDEIALSPPSPQSELRSIAEETITGMRRMLELLPEG